MSGPGTQADFMDKEDTTKMKKSTEDEKRTVNEGTQEEAHCIKCGNYLAEIWHPTYVIIPCSKCKQNNLVDYTGPEPVIKRVRKGA
jgi:phage FluMu protein Com